MQPNAEDRRKLMATEIQEETFEEKGRLVSQREKIAAPTFASRKALKEMVTGKAIKINHKKYMKALAEFNAAVEALIAFKPEVNESKEEVAKRLEEAKSVLRSTADRAITYSKRQPFSKTSKNAPAKIAISKGIKNIKGYNHVALNSWVDDSALYEEVKAKGFPSFVRVAVTGPKGLKVATVELPEGTSDEVIAVVANNTDYRPAVNQINNEQLMRAGLCK